MVSLNEKAFTLIEVLIAFSILSTIVFFMSPVFHILLNQNNMQIELQSMEWEVFCSQATQEITTVSRAEVVSGRLILTKGSDTIQYEKNGTNLRRRVNSAGNEIILQNVAQSSFSIVNNAVRIRVVDLWGHEYSLTAFSFLKWGTAT